MTNVEVAVDLVAMPENQHDDDIVVNYTDHFTAWCESDFGAV
jgi:hypothetical protein